MDEKGFIFTTDAVLALVVVIVLTASVVTYGVLPVYQGQNHQHLEALADSALESMDQSGALREAAVEYSNNNTTGAETTLRTALDTVVPDNVGYRLTMSTNPPVEDSNGVLTSNDVITKIKVISGPQEGWMGRAYYKQDEVQFQDINSTSVTTLWNFHNYLKNYGPWSSGLNTYNYWGGSNGRPQTSIPINFSMPGVPTSSKFLWGGAAGSGQTKIYSGDVIFNGVVHNTVANTSFNYLYNSAGVGPVYNYQKTLPGYILPQGLNNFFVQFTASSSQNMPWFTLISTYTTVISVPKGIANTTIPFPDIAGIGMHNGGIIYNLDTNAITNINGNQTTWTNLQNNFNWPTNTPFELDNIPNVGTGSAVATQQDIYLPPGNRLFDAFTVVNAFGGEDGCVVQVRDSTGTITTVFSSWGNTRRTDGGYGNVPGIINIQPYLKVGHNTVRIITWDDVPGNDFDLVGLESCYSKITYSKFPIRWDTFPFDSYQNTSSSRTTTETQVENFRIDSDAQSALLFVGVGTATRNMTVTIRNSSGTTSVLYPSNKPIPYVLNLGDLDANASQSRHVMTSIVGNGSSLIPGNYSLTVSVTPALAYESGDGASSPPSYGYTGDPTIFSGTRISVIYPKFLQNVWATGFANTPEAASQNAIANLIQTLNDAGYTNIDPSLIRNSTLWTGDVPNAVPVRLDLYTQ